MWVDIGSRQIRYSIHVSVYNDWRSKVYFVNEAKVRRVSKGVKIVLAKLPF